MSNDPSQSEPQPVTEPEEEYVTATQAWQLMGISNARLAQMLASGEVPFLPHPRHKQIKRIPMSFIRQWLKEAGPPLKRKRKKPKKTSRSDAPQIDWAA